MSGGGGWRRSRCNVSTLLCTAAILLPPECLPGSGNLVGAYCDCTRHPPCRCYPPASPSLINCSVSYLVYDQRVGLFVVRSPHGSKATQVSWRAPRRHVTALLPGIARMWCLTQKSRKVPAAHMIPPAVPWCRGCHRSEHVDVLHRATVGAYSVYAFLGESWRV